MRLPIYSEALAALPEAWTTTGAAWLFGTSGMTSPTSGQGWNTFIQSRRYCRIEQRMTRCGLTALTSSTIAVLATLAPDAASPLYEGNGRGPSQIGVDWSGRTLNIYSQPNGSAPTTVASQPLASGHAWGNRQLIEWGWYGRLMSVSLTDTVTLAQTTVTLDRTTATDTNSTAGNCNDVLAFIAPAGQFRVDSLAILYDKPSTSFAPTVLAIGDSITEGDQTLLSNRYASLLDVQMGGRVAISAMGGGRARGGYFAAMTEIAALRPRWIIWALGTNLSAPEWGTDPTRGTKLWNAYTENAFLIGRSVGAKFVIPALLASSYGNGQGGYAGINQHASDIAAANPGEIFQWRWDHALSVGGAGTTQDTSLFRSDLIHPNDAGHAKLVAQLHADVPQLFDAL